MMTRVAAIQTKATASPQHNVAKACEWVRKAAEKGAQLAVLPETFVTLGLPEKELFLLAEPIEQGPFQEILANCAKENQLWLLAGTLPIRDSDANVTKVYSSSLFYSPTGELALRYDKIHLFDVKVGGQADYCESSRILPGTQIKTLNTPVGKIGFAICYDLRFPELFRSFMLQGVELIVLPSAFTIPTGEAHWETLIRARAIENLCYMIAPGEVGIRANGLGTYGHSMIVGPWGEILAQCEMEEGIIVADLDLEKMRKLRQEFPATANTRSFVLKSLAKDH